MSIVDQSAIILVCALDAGILAYAAISYYVRRRSALSPLGRLRIAPRMADRVVAAMIVIYVLVIGGMSIMAFVTSHTDEIDLAQYDQLVWNSLQGRLLENSVIYDAPFFLGKSFTPILLAFVPLYAIWSSPVVLLAVQTIVLALGALPIYWFARRRIGYGLGLVAAAIYLLSPLVQYTNLSDFHEIALATPVLAFATFFLLRRHYAGFITCLVLSLLIKEELFFVAAGMGLFIAIWQRKWVMGLALALFGVAGGGILLQYLIPYWAGTLGKGFYYFSSGGMSGGAARYAYLGNSLGEIASTIVTRPDIVLLHLLIPAKVEYVLQLVVPLGLLPLLGPEVLFLALPTLGYSLLSDYRWQYTLQTAYPAPIIPFLFFASVIAIQRVLSWRAPSEPKRIARQVAVAVFVLTAAAIGYYYDGAGPLSRNFVLSTYLPDERSALGFSFVDAIPSDGVVVTQNEFLAHLSDRRYIYNPAMIPDYRQADYLLVDIKRGWYDIHKGYWDTFLQSGYFEVVDERDGFLLARRRQIDHPADIRFDNRIAYLGYGIASEEQLSGGTTIQPVVRWRAATANPGAYRAVMQLADRDGHVWSRDEHDIFNSDIFRSPSDKAGSIADQFKLRLPPTMPSDAYELTLTLKKASKDEEVSAQDANGVALGTEVVIGKLSVAKDRRPYAAQDLEIEQRLSADLNELRLLGFVPPRSSLKAGELLQIGLYWRALAKPSRDYDIVVQLRDSQGRVKVETTAQPANGNLPTNQWQLGEVLLDWHELTVPTDIQPGDYGITVLARQSKGSAECGSIQVSSVTVLP